MNINQHNNLLEMRVKLSALWIVVLFNMVFRDLHEFARTGYLEELLAMTSNGAEISQGLLMAAAIVLQIPISMIFLTQVLNVKISRWANIGGAIIMILSIIGSNLAPDLDDILFYTAGCAALFGIIWYAWKWSASESRNPSPLPESIKSSV